MLELESHDQPETTVATRHVRKRDGVTLQVFDSMKLRNAVYAAWQSVGTVDEKRWGDVINTVLYSLREDVVDVEVVQDAVETALMFHSQFAVAKAYILYRHHRQELRALREKAVDPKGLSDYIHASKYARYLPDELRREIYSETVARVEAMHIGQFPEMEQEIREAFKLVYDRRVLPSMRSMQFAGPAILKNHNRLYNCSASHVDRFDAFSEALFLLLSGCGVGYSVQFEHVEKMPAIGYVDPKKVKHHVIQDTIEGWADALKALLQSFQIGTNLEFSYHKIRAAGSVLKTSGGRAPGHSKLKESLERIRGVLSAAQGRKLRPLDAHKIMCHAADAVLSGGIRRSAMISLFSLDDSEMMFAKTGNWYETNPWFANANNSVVLKRDEVKKKQFKRIFQMTREWGEPGFFFVSDYDHATNPCCEISLFPVITITTELVGELSARGIDAEVGSTHTGWAMCNLCEINAAKLTSYEEYEEAAKAATLIGTLQASYTKMPYLGWVSEEIVKRDSLLGVGMTGIMDAPHIALNPELQKSVAEKVKEWNREYAARVGINAAARTTCVKPSGCRPWDALTVTDKGVLTLEEMFWHHPTGERWAAQADNLRAVQEGGDSAPIVKTFDNGEAEVLEVEMSYGLVVRSTLNHPWFVEYHHVHEGASVRSAVGAWVPTSNLRVGDVLSINTSVYRNTSSWSFTSVNVRALTMRAACKVIAQPQTLDDDLAWLLGYLWGDGAQSVSKYRVRFTDGLRANLVKARHILKAKFDLDADIKELSDRDAATLEVGSKHLWLWMVRNGIEKYAELETLERIPRCVRGSSWKHIVSFVAGLIDSDGCLNHTRTGTRPQISTACEDFARHLQQVAWTVGLGFGRSLQSKGESFQEQRHLYHLSLSASPTDREAFDHLLSQSVKCQSYMSKGAAVWQMDNDTHRGRQIPGKIRAIRSIGLQPTFDIEVGGSHWFYDGAVKSHNTTSLALGCVGSGIHPHHSKRYIRRVTADELEPVFQAFKAVNPIMCQRKPDGKWVVEFPVEAPANAILKGDQTALEFLEIVRSTQQNWVVTGTNKDHPANNGSHHNVSNTVTVQPEEWEEVANYIWAHREDFTGVSLLPASGDKAYAFSPLEAVTTDADERRWLELATHYKPVDYTTMLESEDGTSLSGELACAGGFCEIKI